MVLLEVGRRPSLGDLSGNRKSKYNNRLDRKMNLSTTPCERYNVYVKVGVQLLGRRNELVV